MKSNYIKQNCTGPDNSDFCIVKFWPTIDKMLLLEERLSQPKLTVCNFQSKKNPEKLNGLLLKYFCYVTWFDERRN